MSKMTGKIGKLLKALEMRNQIYLFTREQVYSPKVKKACMVKKLSYLMPADRYYELHPEKKRKDVEYVKVPVAESFREIDILLELVDIHRRVTECE